MSIDVHVEAEEKRFCKEISNIIIYLVATRSFFYIFDYETVIFWGEVRSFQNMPVSLIYLLGKQIAIFFKNKKVWN